MKKSCIIGLIAVLLIASCSEQSLIDDSVAEMPSVEIEQVNSPTSLVDSYLEKARWGDASAYVKLAECYHDGNGVKADFLGMVTMLMMAERFGGIDALSNYLDSLPNDDNMKMTFRAVARLDHRNYDVTDSIADVLIANGYSEGYSLKGIVQVERGDTLGGQQTIQHGAYSGSTFAELLMCAVPDPGEKSSRVVKMEKIKELSGRVPIADLLLGDMYSGFEGDSVQDDKLAAMYYQQADKQGALADRQARWLLNYYKREGVAVDEKEIERLNILAGNRRARVSHHGDIEPCDTVCTDSICALD